MALIPTLTLFDVDQKKDGQSPDSIARLLARMQGELRAYHDADGEVLFGTDAGYIDIVVPPRFTAFRAAGRPRLLLFP